MAIHHRHLRVRYWRNHHNSLFSVFALKINTHTHTHFLRACECKTKASTNTVKGSHGTPPRSPGYRRQLRSRTGPKMLVLLRVGRPPTTVHHMCTFHSINHRAENTTTNNCHVCSTVLLRRTSCMHLVTPKYISYIGHLDQTYTDKHESAFSSPTLEAARL